MLQSGVTVRVAFFLAAVADLLAGAVGLDWTLQYGSSRQLVGVGLLILASFIAGGMAMWEDVGDKVPGGWRYLLGQEAENDWPEAD